jgi:YVTN family beta-propeller protein
MRTTLLLVIAVLVFMLSDASNKKGLLLVANKGDQSLSIINPETGEQLAVVPEGGTTGHEVIASPDGRFAYVPIYGNSGVGRPGTDGNNLVVVDLQTHKVVGNIEFPHGVRPHCAMFGPKSGLLYVTTEIDNTVAVIDPHTLKIIDSIPTDESQSHMLAITKDESRGYTTNVGTGSVSVLDLKTRKTIAKIPVAPVIQRITLSVDDKMAFTSDQTKPELVVLDLTKNEVKTRVELPGVGYGSAVTKDGKWLVIALAKSNKVAVIDLQAMKVAHTFDVPSAPQFVLIRPDNKFAYISCDQSSKVAVLNLSSWKIEKLLDAGKGADGLAWAQ